MAQRLPYFATLVAASGTTLAGLEAVKNEFSLAEAKDASQLSFEGLKVSSHFGWLLGDSEAKLFWKTKRMNFRTDLLRHARKVMRVARLLLHEPASGGVLRGIVNVSALHPDIRLNQESNRVGMKSRSFCVYLRPNA